MRETQRAVMVSLRVIFCWCLQTDKSKYSRGLYCATALISCSPESLLLVSAPCLGVSRRRLVCEGTRTQRCPCSRSFIEPTAIFDHTSDNTMMDVMTLRHSIHEFQNSCGTEHARTVCTRLFFSPLLRKNLGMRLQQVQHLVCSASASHQLQVHVHIW